MSGFTTCHYSSRCTRKRIFQQSFLTSFCEKGTRKQRTQKNVDIAHWSMRHNAFLSRRTRRTIFRPSERILSLSLSLFSFLYHLLHPVSSPPRVSLWHGHRQMGPSILRSHCYSKYPTPLRTRARAREKDKEKERRESESTAQCVTMPGHSWHCYRYCYYYRYCCRLWPSGEWESRGPMSQLLRRVLH